MCLAELPNILHRDNLKTYIVYSIRYISTLHVYRGTYNRQMANKSDALELMQVISENGFK